MRISGPIAAYALHNVFGARMILFSDRHVEPRGLCKACHPPECMSIADFLVSNIDSSEAGGPRVLLLLETEGPSDDKVLKGWKDKHPYQLVKAMWALRPFWKGRKHLKRTKVLWTDVRKHPPARLMTNVENWLREVLKVMNSNKIEIAQLRLDMKAQRQFAAFPTLKKMKMFYDTLCFEGLPVSNKDRKDKVRKAKYSKHAGMIMAKEYSSLNASQQHAIKKYYEERWNCLLTQKSCLDWKETISKMMSNQQVTFDKLINVTLILSKIGCVYIDIYIITSIMKNAPDFDVILGYFGEIIVTCCQSV